MNPHIELEQEWLCRHASFLSVTRLKIGASSSSRSAVGRRPRTSSSTSGYLLAGTGNDLRGLVRGLRGSQDRRQGRSHRHHIEEPTTWT